MKKFWKSVKIWQSYGREFSGLLFLAHPVYIQSTTFGLLLHNQTVVDKR